MPIIINAISLFGAFSSVNIMDRFGRKTIVLFGSLTLAIIDIVIGILFVFSEWPPSGIFVFVLLIFYMYIFGLTAGPIVWIYVP